VPLVVRAPRVAPRVVDDLVGTIDVAPTLLDLAALPPLEPCQGRSLRAFLEGGSLPPREYLAETGEPLFWDDHRSNPRFADRATPPDDPVDRMRAFLTPTRLKLVFDPQRGEGEAVELFDLRTDPDEQAGAILPAERLSREHMRAMRFLRGLTALDRGHAGAEMDDATREALAQSGYLIAPPPPPPSPRKEK
jgi:arylsulfatase A-like enzyme